eukprot:scaffold71371_cov17-Tisochrysis_lutea.AAC.1
MLRKKDLPSSSAVPSTSRKTGLASAGERGRPPTRKVAAATSGFAEEKARRAARAWGRDRPVAWANARAGSH